LTQVCVELDKAPLRRSDLELPQMHQVATILGLKVIQTRAPKPVNP